MQNVAERQRIHTTSCRYYCQLLGCAGTTVCRFNSEELAGSHLQVDWCLMLTSFEYFVFFIRILNGSYHQLRKILSFMAFSVWHFAPCGRILCGKIALVAFSFYDVMNHNVMSARTYLILILMYNNYSGRIALCRIGF